jgi:hypothetical protein
VFDWELDRKKQVKMLKKICYYPPSLVKKSRLKSKRKIDPNYEVFNYYHNNLLQGARSSTEFLNEDSKGYASGGTADHHYTQ